MGHRAGRVSSSQPQGLPFLSDLIFQVMFQEPDPGQCLALLWVAGRNGNCIRELPCLSKQHLSTALLCRHRQTHGLVTNRDDPRSTDLRAEASFSLPCPLAPQGLLSALVATCFWDSGLCLLCSSSLLISCLRKQLPLLKLEFPTSFCGKIQ